MRNRLDGKVALVTGGGMGMGAATAQVMAGYGASVMVADRNMAAAQETVQAILDAGGTAVAQSCDVAEEAQVAEMIAACVAAFGRLDCAVNNAAIAPDLLPIADADMEVWDRVIRVNLRSVMLCMKYEIRQMLAQGDAGAIVNIASVSSVRPLPGNSAYVAAKHGVIGLTKTGSVEVAPKGIRVNAVMPGAIDTPMLRQSLADTGYSEADFAPALSLFGRFGRPEEVAEASAWLCSDAASYVTGHALGVEAGYLTR
ncbi:MULTISPECIES: glucose 1-dehydrogenase [unclassified Novosphingobium]|uniref:glucose 1-dehydrogenase n=1 Tax=unclassified Novosphingobium TaxID=2644732 RepID=UPI00086CCAB9|nr:MULTISPECIES: glucose 1-dehydrogenase [unclassified Novosphingobium]MBN9146264.1 glucose 1-dehydrogenase [Novosphingobium sp.]MDR6707140.1 glucose 1-dehydrogenase [Novosphingobium sp. 1748]NKJ02739.1 glucose 1-dehydrogenase [Novosphingobium sp. SG707]ODU79326.1 MAG: glucose dehydrogenase [Novosphingobium sp. SCN 63-17]OJX93182.1 MAG: glucose dehydrogenase [Novosphingobium sp. 63-713]